MRRAAGAGLWLVAAALVACTEPAPPTGELELMAARCVEQMYSDTCRAEADRRRGPMPDDGRAGPVFVAGIGAIDARTYAEIRSHGEALCATALQACWRDLASPRCAVARQPWGAAPATGR